MAYQIVICECQKERRLRISRVINQVLSQEKWGKYLLIRISTLEEQADWPQTIFQSHLYLLSLDMENILSFGQEIYRKNQWAPIVFYGRQQAFQELNELLRARPIAFWDVESGEGTLKNLIHDLICQPLLALSVLPVDTRTQRLYLPQDHILWVCTGRAHYVDICYEAAGSDSRTEYCHAEQRTTVDRIQRNLSQSWFIRIHKSTIVAIRYIQQFDKRDHVIKLKNGEVFSVSDRYYGEVKERLSFFDV